MNEMNELTPGFGSDFMLTLLTDDPTLAAHAAAAGVQRIGPDLEQLGKQERQSTGGTRVSFHDEACLPLIRDVIGDATLFARLNPINPDTPEEIERLLAQGVGNLMLPYFHKLDEVKRFVDLVAGRAIVTPLVETAAAAVQIEEIARLPGVDEIHVGLTDMMLSLKTHSRFHIMASWFMSGLAETVHCCGKPLHLAGIARLNDERLPLSADVILAQYPRLGAHGALLTRVFVDGIETAEDFQTEIKATRDRLDYWGQAPKSFLDEQHQTLTRLAADTGEGPSIP
jgi:hypothetical protein